ncbi:porin family protein [Muriicola sp. SD30]|uniref:porin family protein n=1 Tax=Muriicola sp. SD30 TaxID=3240936 RepID=UPI00350F9A8C
MKLHVFALCALLTVSVSSFAQDVEFGIKGGLNFSSINVDPQEDLPNPDSRIGFHLGGVANFGLSEKLDVQSELLLNTVGAKFEGVDDIERVKLTYLSLLGAFKYNIDENFNIVLGPQINLLTGGEFEEEDKIENSKESLDANNFYKGTDFSLALGVGYKIDDNIELGVRYNIGLTDNNDDAIEEGFFDSNQALKNRFIQLSAIFFFD